MERHRVDIAASMQDVLPVLTSIDFVAAEGADGSGLVHLVDGVGLLNEVGGGRTRIHILDQDEGVTVQRLVDSLLAHGFEVSHRELE